MNPTPPQKNNTSYLVTGSTGYIGRNLVQALIQRQAYRVFGLSLPGDANQRPSEEGFRSIEADVLDAHLPDLLEELQPDVIFHCVGADRNAPLKEQLAINVEGARHLLQSVVDTQLTSRIILLGSAAEYGVHAGPVDENTRPEPMSEYGVAKYSQTLVAMLYARKYHLPIIVARLFNPYGCSPQGFVIASLASQIARQEAAMREQGLSFPRVKINNLECFRDFIHIDDVSSGLIALAERGYPGEIYNLSSGHAVPIRLVLEGLLASSRLKDPQIVLEGEPDLDFSQGVIQKIIAHTGWRPQVSLEKGLMQELNYWRDRAAFLARV